MTRLKPLTLCTSHLSGRSCTCCVRFFWILVGSEFIDETFVLVSANALGTEKYFLISPSLKNEVNQIQLIATGFSTVLAQVVNATS